MRVSDVLYYEAEVAAPLVATVAVLPGFNEAFSF